MAAALTLRSPCAARRSYSRCEANALGPSWLPVKLVGPHRLRRPVVGDQLRKCLRTVDECTALSCRLRDMVARITRVLVGHGDYGKADRAASRASISCGAQFFTALSVTNSSDEAVAVSSSMGNRPVG